MLVDVYNSHAEEIQHLRNSNIPVDRAGISPSRTLCIFVDEELRTMTILHRLRFTLYLLRHRTDPNYLAIMVLVHTTTRQLIHEVWRKEPQ